MGGNTQNVDMAKAYRIRVETELHRLCEEILSLIDNSLIPPSSSGECKGFYYKMKGDYFRYIAEFTEGEGKTGAANSAHDAYKEAMAVATTDLVVTHPIRLGLALNFSVFHYEVLGNPEEACKMARQAFEDAIAELDSVSEDSYKDSTLIMQLLRDNLRCGRRTVRALRARCHALRAVSFCKHPFLQSLTVHRKWDIRPGEFLR